MLNGNKRNFDLLLEAGANIDGRNLAGKTPLTYASLHGRFDFVLFLLEAGADYTIKDNLGHDLVHNVVATFLSSPTSPAWDWREKVIQFLEQKGVDFDLESKKVIAAEKGRNDNLQEWWNQRLRWLEKSKNVTVEKPTRTH